MSSGYLKGTGVKFFEEVVAGGGKGTFVLPFALTANSVVFVNGQLTDLAYTGLGTLAINFVPNLIQGDKLTVKE